VLGLDPVPLGRAVLAQEDQRRGVGGLGGEQQVEQDERVWVEVFGVQVAHRGEGVVAQPQDDQDALGDDEALRAEDRRDLVRDPRAQGQIVMADLVRRGAVPHRAWWLWEATR
jgi:hypothetical protein